MTILLPAGPAALEVAPKRGDDMDYTNEIADTERAVIEAAITWYHAVRAGKGDEGGEVPGLVDVVGALLSLRAAAGVTTSTDNRTPPWRSVKDDPPGVDSVCPVWMGWPLCLSETGIASRISETEFEFYDNTGNEMSPTHWMSIADWPLPPAPELTP